MSLTVCYHKPRTDPISGWKHVNAHAIHSQFKIYEEPLTILPRLKIILEIVFKTIFTFGYYYLAYLRRTSDGKADLENLKKRILVHYVPQNIPEGTTKESTKVRDIVQTINHHVSAEEIFNHRELIKINQQQEQDIEKISEIKLTDIFKACIKQVHDFRDICNGIQEIIQFKRVHLLEFLCEKNEKLTAALEKYLDLAEEQQDNYNLIKILSPFLKESDLIQILKTAVETAKKANRKRKTVFHEKFEEFHLIYGSLASKKIDWLIAIHKKKELYSVIKKIFLIGDHYSPRFKSLYESRKELFEQCLRSMEAEIEVDDEMRGALEQSFYEWKKILNALQENLVSAFISETKGVYYSLGMHFQKELIQKGFNEDFQAAIASNEINFGFIDLFCRGKTKTVRDNIENLLKDKKFKEAAEECERKILQENFKTEEALKKSESEDARTTFANMKTCFIDNPNNNDAVQVIVEVEILFKFNHPDSMDAMFFDFLRVLKLSEFYIKAGKDINMKDFYMEFKDYFTSIDSIIALFDSIMEKNAN